MVLGAVSWPEVFLAALANVLVGVALWLLLPRGVTLVGSARTQDHFGQRLDDTWEIRNASPLPIRIRSVRLEGVGILNLDTEKPETIELPWDGFQGTTLEYDDANLANARGDSQGPWASQTVQCGDALVAHVTGNTALTVNYRRGGPFGWTERRSITIQGHT